MLKNKKAFVFTQPILIIILAIVLVVGVRGLSKDRFEFVRSKSGSLTIFSINEVESQGGVLFPDGKRYQSSFTTIPNVKDATSGDITLLNGESFIVEKEVKKTTSGGLVCVSASRETSDGSMMVLETQEFNAIIPCPPAPSSRTSSGGYICYRITKDAAGCAVYTWRAAVSRSTQCAEMGYSSSVPGPFASEVVLSCTGTLSAVIGGMIEPNEVNEFTSENFGIGKIGTWNINDQPTIVGFNHITIPIITIPPTTMPPIITIPPTILPIPISTSPPMPLPKKGVCGPTLLLLLSLVALGGKKWLGY